MSLKIYSTVTAILMLGTMVSCTRESEQPAKSKGHNAVAAEQSTAKDKEETNCPPGATREFSLAGEGPRPDSNEFCMVCHEPMAKELITKAHAIEDILCIDCHGRSRLHMEDEMLMTQADYLFGRSQVNALCKACHGPHEKPIKVDEFLEKWQGRDRPNGRVITAGSICTDCHGTHNIATTAAGKGKKSEDEQQEEQAKWTPLFNGKDLTGFKPIGNARWTVERGMLVGTQGENFAPGDLLTEADYKDFLLTVTYKAEWPCNTGIWFRYQSDQKTYQADILEWPNPECYSGTVYCPGKMFISMNTDKNLVDREGWNTISVQAQGDHLQTWINGHQVGDVHDDSSDHGKIGIQVHPGEQFGKMKIIISEFKIQPLDEVK